MPLVLSWPGMKALLIVAVVAIGLVGAYLRLSRPKPEPDRDPGSPGASASPAAAGPLWPLAVGNAWVYTETSPERAGSSEVTIAVTAEERTGFRLVEERAGQNADTNTGATGSRSGDPNTGKTASRSGDTDLIETRADGFYYLEFESAKEATLLLPCGAPGVRDWSCSSDMRASVVRETEFRLGDRAYPAFEVRYERKLEQPDGSQPWAEEQTLTFARGLGMVRKDTTRGRSAPFTPRPGGPLALYVWKLIRFTPATEK